MAIVRTSTVWISTGGSLPTATSPSPTILIFPKEGRVHHWYSRERDFTQKWSNRYNMETLSILKYQDIITMIFTVLRGDACICLNMPTPFPNLKYSIIFSLLPAQSTSRPIRHASQILFQRVCEDHTQISLDQTWKGARFYRSDNTTQANLQDTAKTHYIV